MEPLTREQIIEALRLATAPLDYVNAMWLGGSDAFGLADEYSDVDVQFDVATGRVDDAFRTIEFSLEAVSPFITRWVLPKPTWHGHDQRCYRLKDASRYHIVDMVIMERDSAPRFNERELHGEPVVIFDKLGVIKSVANDRDALREKLRERMTQLKLSASIMDGFGEKEILRGNLLGALNFHWAFMQRHLQQVLRMRHSPHRFEFSLRYMDLDLPADVAERFRALCLCDGLTDLGAKHRAALEWFWEVAEALNIDALEL